MPSVSKQQQKFFGLVRALQKGDVSPSSVSKKARDAAKSIKKSDVKKYAATKHKGLPKKVKQETKVRNLIRKMVREIMAEDFAGAYPKHMRKSFDKMRQKQSEVLGYTLTGKSDIKTEIDDATIKEEKLNEKCWKGYEKKGTKMMFGKRYPNCVKKKKSEGKLKEGGVEKVLAMADGGYGKLGGKIVDGMSANLFKAVYNKANDKTKEKINKMNEKQLYVFMTKLWNKFGKQVSL